MKTALIFIARTFLANCAPARYLYFGWVEWRLQHNLNRQIARSEGKVKTILESLRDNGLYIEEGFWDTHRTSQHREALDRAYLGKTAGFQAEVNQYLGSDRYYYVEKDVQALEPDFKEHPILREVARKFYGFDPRERKIMYQHSYFTPAVSEFYRKDLGQEVGTTPISPRFHFDFMRPTVKAVLYLSDIDAKRGATEFCHKSQLRSRWKIKLSRLRKQSLALQDRLKGRTPKLGTVWTHAEAGQLGIDRISQPLEGRPGTLAIFNTFTIHRASELMEGERRVLWYYFNP